MPMATTRSSTGSRRAVTHNGQTIVLIERTRPGAYLTTPGGGVNPDETWEQAAAHECMEELGAAAVVGSAAYVAYRAEPAVARSDPAVLRGALGQR